MNEADDETTRTQLMMDQEPELLMPVQHSSTGGTTSALQSEHGAFHPMKTRSRTTSKLGLMPVQHSSTRGTTSALQSEHGAFHPMKTRSRTTSKLGLMPVQHSPALQYEDFVSSLQRLATVQPNPASRQQSGRRKIMQKSKNQTYPQKHHKAYPSIEFRAQKKRKREFIEHIEKVIGKIRNHGNLAKLLTYCGDMVNRMVMKGSTKEECRQAGIKHMEENMTTLYGFDPQDARSMIDRFTVDSQKKKGDIWSLILDLSDDLEEEDNNSILMSETELLNMIDRFTVDSVKYMDRSFVLDDCDDWEEEVNNWYKEMVLCVCRLHSLHITSK